MKLRHSQRGAGWFGLMYTLGSLGFFVFIGLKIYPIYLNEMKLARAITRVASEFDANTAGERPDEVKNALQKWWNVEDIEKLTPKDIKIKNTAKGKMLTYDYTNEALLFSNISVSFHFVREEPLKGMSN